MTVSFKISRRDKLALDCVISRTLTLAPDFASKMELSMDLVATHANGCRMDFEALAAADDFNLLHDVAGIRRHLDRTTGKLGDCFVPRFAIPTPRMVRLLAAARLDGAQ